jgi:hypothetical protein
MPCTCEPVSSATHNKLAANLYCNDYQIDLSAFPLIDICDEVTGDDVTYVSVKLLDIYEILEVYNNYNSKYMSFYTSEFLSQAYRWISRAEFEAEVLYISGEYDHKGLYYDEMSRHLYYAENPERGDDVVVVSCGENYYVDVATMIGTTPGYSKMYDRIVDSSHFQEYEPGFSVVPVIYPAVNKEFLHHDDIDYDIAKKTVLEIISNGEELYPDGVNKDNRLWMYEYFDVNNRENFETNSYYVPLKLTYETAGYAVISDDEKQNYFIYSEEYIKENPDWKTVDKMQNIFSALAKFTGKNVTVKYDENEKKLFFENESVTDSVEAAAFGKNAYVRISDAVNVYKKISYTH